MTLITDGVRVYEHDHLLTGDVEIYAHEQGLLVAYSRDKNKMTAIDPIGMTADEVERSVILANRVLAGADPAPVNRKQRRASEAERRAMN